MQLDGLLHLYILFRSRNIDFFVGYCAQKRNLMRAHLAGERDMENYLPGKRGSRHHNTGISATGNQAGPVVM